MNKKDIEQKILELEAEMFRKTQEFEQFTEMVNQKTRETQDFFTNKNAAVAVYKEMLDVKDD